MISTLSYIYALHSGDKKEIAYHDPHVMVNTYWVVHKFRNPCLSTRFYQSPQFLSSRYDSVEGSRQNIQLLLPLTS